MAAQTPSGTSQAILHHVPGIGIPQKPVEGLRNGLAAADH